jgi:acyl carrier protein
MPPLDDDAAFQLIREALCEVAPDKAGQFALVGPETEIKDLGIDSIRVMEMVGNIEDRLGRTFTEDALASAKTLSHVVALMRGASNPPN